MHTPDPVPFRQKLVRRARRLGMPPPDAEDAAQEVLLRLMLAQRRAPISRPEHYAQTILRNLARARGRAAPPPEQIGENDGRLIPQPIARLSLAELTAALDTLPPEQSCILRLILSGRESPAEIAQMLDLPSGTVMSRLARARASLRARFDMPERGSLHELL
ncbi:sigma-70 family RNA polymerase sigma factor [Sulfitobacter albidus]|uniref:Sigma-70 family RNA polymerase sigma factor n=1 Tax=Sulfitobacter albidus TaxID=2829501 RepID=A0A975PNU3_9RHOB|nr:sigma-70 family RNA polymerase sigma factor [Sulfitobacter albidus]QUJ77826.1 sigma-70 family RNA polymerase sigma factor [Sulfitobacter albidus]